MKILAENGTTEVIGSTSYANRADIIVHTLVLPDQRANLAIELIRSWGMVAGCPANEGEMRDDRNIKLMPVEDVVKRACDVSQQAYEMFRDRGWLLDVPSFAEINGCKD